MTTRAKGLTTPLRVEATTYNVFEKMTASEIISVLAYNYSVDVSVAVQAAMNQASTKQLKLDLPAGGYLCNTTLVVPKLISKYATFYMRGHGIGNPFTDGAWGTRIRRTTPGRVLEYIGVAPIAADQEVHIEGIYFKNTSAANTDALVYIDGLYGLSTFVNNGGYQVGTGNGFDIVYSAGANIQHNYVMNRDAVTTGLGAARVGIGFNIINNWGSGLTTLYKNSSRGFHTSYKLGDNTPNSISSFAMKHNECSMYYTGIDIGTGSNQSTVDDNYFEGGEGGTGIINAGRVTKITKNMFFSGNAINIDSLANTYGTTITENSCVVKDANEIGIRLDTSGAYVGIGHVVRDNTITWGYSGGTIPGVVGIEIIGDRPRIDMSGTVFNPTIAWIGGAGTMKFKDSSTTTLGTGSGLFGFGFGEGGHVLFPKMHQGALSLALGTSVLTQADVTANILALTGASDFVMTATAATTVNGFSATQLEGKLFYIRTTNANTTFANTATLKMAGGANYTPGANGAMLCFKVHSDVAWECSGRVAY